MNTLEQKVRQHRSAAELRDARVLTGHQAAPACFTCGHASTHVTDRVTPAGYRAYQCDKHATVTRPLFGADPGWQSVYVKLPAGVSEQEVGG
jgi:hypothetical protein